MPEDQDAYEPETPTQGQPQESVANTTEELWTDDSRPHGTPAHDGTTSHWDATLRAWVDGGYVAREPVALDNAEMDAKLLSFAYHNKPRLTMLATTIRHLMQIAYESTAGSPYNAQTRAEF